jgi:Pyridine nucleotide-disulphide oxidoreductase
LRDRAILEQRASAPVHHHPGEARRSPALGRLACAIELQREGLETLTLDKGCIVNSLYRFPTQMVYFTTPELLEIGGYPLICQAEKPNRIEALKYYRRVVEASGVRVNQYEAVGTVSGRGGPALTPAYSRRPEEWPRPSSAPAAPAAV